MSLSEERHPTKASATSATYRPTLADIGSRLAVTVTASAPDFSTLAATSAATARVAKETASLAGSLVKGTSRSRVALRVKLRAPSGVTPTGTLRVTYGKKTRTVTVKASHRGVVTVKVPRSKPTGTLTARFTPSGEAARYLEASTLTYKIAKVTPKVRLTAPKKVAKGKSARITVRVTAKNLTTAPSGKVTITYGSKKHVVKLTAKHRGKVTVRLALAKGKHKVRATYTPSSTWKKYVAKKSSTSTTVRAR